MDIFNELFGTRIGDNIIFTPQKIALEMIDALPAEIWNRKTRFLDPCCKSGIYLQEIRKRLMGCTDLVETYPDEHARLKHIDNEQLYGLAINEVCRLLSTRNVYGRIVADSNIRYIENYISKVKDKNTDYRKMIKEEFGEVKFDVVIGNPPYQEMDNRIDVKGNNNLGSAVSIYQHFMISAIDICQDGYISFIIPARWYNSGKGVRLNEFKEKMMLNNNLMLLKDYPDSTSCFENLRIAGGVCHYIFSNRYNGKCTIISDEARSDVNLSNYNGTLIRNITLLGIVDKVLAIKVARLSEYVLCNNPYSFRTYQQGRETKSQADNLELLSSNGKITYTNINEVEYNTELVRCYKVVTGRLSPDTVGKNENFNILNKPKVLGKNTICTETYTVLAYFNTQDSANNMQKYVMSKLFRALVYATLSGMNLSIGSYKFIPIQDFTNQSDIDWSQSIANIDQQLYKKYKLTQEEIDYIEKIIKPME